MNALHGAWAWRRRRQATVDRGHFSFVDDRVGVLPASSSWGAVRAATSTTPSRAARWHEPPTHRDRARRPPRRPPPRASRPPWASLVYAVSTLLLAYPALAGRSSSIRAATSTRPATPSASSPRRIAEKRPRIPAVESLHRRRPAVRRRDARRHFLSDVPAAHDHAHGHAP